VARRGTISREVFIARSAWAIREIVSMQAAPGAARDLVTIKGGAKIDHETPAEWRIVAVQKVTTTLQFH
jgi:hypothetical protein